MSVKFNTLLEADMAFITSTEQGRRVLRHVMHQCGFHKASIVLSRIDDEINVRATISNETLRAFYLNLRGLIPFIDRVFIENEEPIPEPEPKAKGKRKAKNTEETGETPEWTLQRPKPNIAEDPLHNTRLIASAVEVGDI